MIDKLFPVHPGVVLLEEFIKPMGLGQNRLAIDIRVDVRRINEIVLGKRCYRRYCPTLLTLFWQFTSILDEVAVTIRS